MTAQRFGNDELDKTVLQKLGENFLQLSKSNALVALDATAIEKVVEYERLWIRSELEYFAQ